MNDGGYFVVRITLGEVLTLLSVLIVGGKILLELGAIKTKVDTMWAWWKRNVPRGGIAVVRGASEE